MFLAFQGHFRREEGSGAGLTPKWNVRLLLCKRDYLSHFLEVKANRKSFVTTCR